MIEVKDLHKRIGPRDVLNGVSFTVPEAEVFGLVGANGSGKTTVLRILATLLVADSGSACIAGLSVAGEPEKVRTKIGYMPEVFGVYPRLTTEEHLVFYAGIHGIARAQRSLVAGELLELVGLTSRSRDDADSLSPGCKQRLGLAQALVNDPQVLLLDDISSLDSRARTDFEGLIGELQKLGKTILLSSRHLRDVEELCTWLGVIEEGSMVAAGPKAELQGEVLCQDFRKS